MPRIHKRWVEVPGHIFGVSNSQLGSDSPIKYSEAVSKPFRWRDPIILGSIRVSTSVKHQPTGINTSKNITRRKLNVSCTKYADLLDGHSYLLMKVVEQLQSCFIVRASLDLVSYVLSSTGGCKKFYTCREKHRVPTRINLVSLSPLL